MESSEHVLTKAETESLTYGFDLPISKPFSNSETKEFSMMEDKETLDKLDFPYLNTINQRFATFFNTSLSLLLPSSTEVATNLVQTEAYTDFTERFGQYASVNVFSMEPLDGHGLILLDTLLVSAIMDNLFGGGKLIQSDLANREFTQTEFRIIRRVINLALDAQKKAWDLVQNLEFNLVRTETKTQFARIASPKDFVITTTYYIRLGEFCGQMQICIPTKTLNPIHDLLQHHVHREHTATSKALWNHSLKKQIHSAEIDLTAVLTTIPTSLRQITTLKKGDFLAFKMPKTIAVNVHGLPIMECTVGQSNGKYGLKVEKILKHTLKMVDTSTDPN